MADGVAGMLAGLGTGVIGSAIVNLQVADAGYKKSLAQAEAQGKATTSSMGQSFSRFKALAGPALLAVGAAAVAGAAMAVKAASDQEEALNKVKVVFAGASGTVEEFADAAAESFGISKSAALAAAGTFGNLFTNVGFADQAAADMSTSFVALAADLASFNNIGTDEALEKLRAGLAGEAEPLRAVGVFLSEAKVQAEAYSSGIAEVGAELTDQEKIQARYNIILAETTLAQGDFARTSDSLANQQRTLAAKFQDLAATIGSALVPAVSKLLDGFLLLADNLPTIIKLVGAFIAAWALANLTQIATAISNITRMLGAMSVALVKGGTAAAGLRTKLKAIGGVAATFAVFEGFSHISEQLNTANDELAQSVGVTEEEFNKLEDLANESFGFGELENFLSLDWSGSKEAATEIGTAWAEAKKKLQEAGIPAAEVTEIFREQSSTVNADRDSIDDFRRSLGIAVNGAILFKDGVYDANAAIREQGAGLRRTSKRMEDWSLLTQDAFREAIGSVEDFSAKWSITSRQFLRNIQGMAAKAKDLRRAMREIAEDRATIPEGFLTFLQQQGPDSMVAFAEGTKAQQRKMIEGWKDYETTVRNSKVPVDQLREAVERVGKKKTKAEVEIHYFTSGVKVSDLPGFSGDDTTVTP